jgi:hypothetical protein
MDGGAVMVERQRAIEPGWSYCVTDGEAREALEIRRASPEALHSAATVPFDPAAAERAAAQYARRRNLTRDSLLALYDRQEISRQELRAGREICLVAEWRAGAHTVLGRTGGYMERMAASTGMEAAPLWMLMEEAERARYLPWRAWADAYPLKRDARLAKTVTLATLVELVAVSNRGIRQAADTLRLQQMRAQRLLRRGLWTYAVRAGWAEGERPVSLEARVSA